jgi:hypothetical protein
VILEKLGAFLQNNAMQLWLTGISPIRSNLDRPIQIGRLVTAGRGAQRAGGGGATASDGAGRGLADVSRTQARELDFARALHQDKKDDTGDASRVSGWAHGQRRLRAARRGGRPRRGNSGERMRAVQHTRVQTNGTADLLTSFLSS